MDLYETVPRKMFSTFVSSEFSLLLYLLVLTFFERVELFCHISKPLWNIGIDLGYFLLMRS